MYFQSRYYTCDPGARMSGEEREKRCVSVKLNYRRVSIFANFRQSTRTGVRDVARARAQKQDVSAS